MVGAALAALAFCGGASAASAKIRLFVEVQPAYASAAIYLGREDGYDFFLSLPNEHVAVLYLSTVGEVGSGEESSSALASTAYSVPAEADLSHGVLRARFGRLGRVALRFRRSGPVKRGARRERCVGPRPQRERGRFTGVISLRGEHGYFRFTRTSAGGEVTRSFRLRCRKGYADHAINRRPQYYVFPSFSFPFGSGGGSIALLWAASKHDGRYVVLRAAHLQGSEGAEIVVSAFEKRGALAIGRGASGYTGPGVLASSSPGQHPATASLTPPAPFEGEAEYLENSARSHSWTGSLRVATPGLDLRLAGDDFASSLCVVSPLRTPSGCDFAKQRPLEYARVASASAGGAG
jgi:hypothetical protein